MLTELRRADTPHAGACFDCGALVQRRIACIDEITHSLVDLCERCWSVSQQQKIFAGGCCG
jgi:hypothetical protein